MRAAPPRSRCFARQRGTGARSRASCGSSSIRARTCAADGGDRSAQPGGTATTSRRDLERVLADAASTGQTLGDAFLQLNQALLGTTRQGGGLFAGHRTGEALSRASPKRSSPSRSRATTPGSTTSRSWPRRRAPSTARSSSSPAGNAPRWSRPTSSPRARPKRRSATSTVSSPKRRESRAAAGALAQLYVEQKRYARGARGIPALVGRGPDGSRVRVRGRRAFDADEGLRERAALFESSRTPATASRERSRSISAQIAEETSRYDDAIARYREVTEGERAWLAKLRIGAMMASRASSTPRGAISPGLTPDGREQRVQLTQAEAQLLRDAGDYKGAYAVSDAPRSPANPIPPICSTTSRWSPRSSTGSTRSRRG